MFIKNAIHQKKLVGIYPAVDLSIRYHFGEEFYQFGINSIILYLSGSRIYLSGTIFYLSGGIFWHYRIDNYLSGEQKWFFRIDFASFRIDNSKTFETLSILSETFDRKFIFPVLLSKLVWEFSETAGNIPKKILIAIGLIW